MYNSCRVPVVPSDVTNTYDPNAHRHIVVIRKGKIFTVDVAGKGGAWLNESELEAAFEAVKASADADGFASFPVGALTSENRDKWAEVVEGYRDGMYISHCHQRARARYSRTNASGSTLQATRSRSRRSSRPFWQSASMTRHRLPATRLGGRYGMAMARTGGTTKRCNLLYLRTARLGFWVNMR